MSHQFDEVAKALASEEAQTLSRRQMLRRVGGGLAGVMLASMGMPWGMKEAGAVTKASTKAKQRCQSHCRGVTNGASQNNPGYKSCYNACMECGGETSSVCGSGTNFACCTTDETCEAGVCVGQGICGPLDCNDSGFVQVNPGACDPTCGLGCVTTVEGDDVCLQGSINFAPCDSSDDCQENYVCVEVAESCGFPSETACFQQC